MARLTDEHYRQILTFCQSQKTTSDICEKISATNDYMNNVLRVMVRAGMLNYSRVPYRGQYKNAYTTTPDAFDILDARIAKAKAKQEAEKLIMKRAERKVKPVESYYTSPEVGIIRAKERHPPRVDKRHVKISVGMGKMAYC